MASVLAAVALAAGAVLVAGNPAAASMSPAPVITGYPAAASMSPAPAITGLTATSPQVTQAGTTASIAASVSGATMCEVSSSPPLLYGAGAVSCAAGSFSDPLLFPTSASSTVYVVTVTAQGPGGVTSTSLRMKVKGTGGAISAVQSVASDGEGSCALLASGGVDCWGYGVNGQLGNGQFYTSSPYGSATPVPVEGVGGTGTLTGVSSLIADNGYGYCALLASGGVDCWGFGQVGGLGDGQFSDSAVPAQVLDPDGVDVLSGVSSLASDGLGYCALLTSAAVDCWGYGPNGELGNGQLYSSSPYGSAVPVQVESVDGSTSLSGVSSVTGGDDGYCAVLTAGGVDCWGGGVPGPVQVESVDGTSYLSGVSSVASDATGAYCALLNSGDVDCWGYGANGELGNGQYYSSGSNGSSTPVQVESVDGTAYLSGVSSVTSDQDGFCALLASGGVDCWGNGTFGILGDGQFSDSDMPVQVESVAGGVLHKVFALTGDGNGFCALLGSSAVDCWGEGGEGGLGNGQFYSNPDGSAVPVQVIGVGAVGTLSGVSSITGGGDGYCALLTSTGVDCWGAGTQGDLGNGRFYPANPGGSAVPVPVI